MKIHIVAIGERMPAWVNEGVETYRRRLAHYFSLQLTEIPLVKRSKGADIQRIKKQEAHQMLASIKNPSRIIALDVQGEAWDTFKLTEILRTYRDHSIETTLLIGGPDGLGEECLNRADKKWSLSNLTLPHTLVRLVLFEALYRAFTLLTGHPYHR